MNYKRIKQPLIQGGYLELGELVVVEADEFSAVVEVLEVDRDHWTLCIVRFTICGDPPSHYRFEVKPEDQAI